MPSGYSALAGKPVTSIMSEGLAIKQPVTVFAKSHSLLEGSVCKRASLWTLKIRKIKLDSGQGFFRGEPSHDWCTQGLGHLLRATGPFWMCWIWRPSKHSGCGKAARLTLRTPAVCSATSMIRPSSTHPYLSPRHPLPRSSLYPGPLPRF